MAIGVCLTCHAWYGMSSLHAAQPAQLQKHVASSIEPETERCIPALLRHT